LEDAGQVIMESTKVGYLRESAPDGKKWEANPGWYKNMKRNAATLTGPTSKALGGPLAGKYEFAQINLRRMKNSLRKNVNVTKKEVVVDYMPSVQDRAEMTDFGREGKIILNSTSGNKTIEMSVSITPRTHLGVAKDIPRLGFKTDPQHIAEIFGNMVDEHLNVL